ncbi:MAG: hypothetical protein ACO3C1_00260 [Ilumatobacteraceae bacterium]
MSDDAASRLVSRIEALVDELDELMFDRLRAAAAERTGRPADDKRLLQARRALDKAARILRGAGAAGDDD